MGLLGRLGADLNPFDGPKKAPLVNTKLLAQSLQAKYGKLVNNPQLQQTVLRQAMPHAPTLADRINTVGSAIGQASQKTILQPFITQPLAEIATSLRGKSYTPGSPLEQQLFGNQTIKPVKEDVRGVYQANKKAGGIRGVAAPVLAAGDLAMHVANDLPAGKLVKGVSKPLSEVAKDLILTKPFRNVSDKDLAAVSRVAQARQGFGQSASNLKPGDTNIYRNVQRKIGAAPNDHAAIDNLIAARRTHEVKMAQVNEALQKIKPKGLGMSTLAVDDKGNPIVPPGKPKVGQNSFTTGAKQGRQSISSDLQKDVSGEHIVRNTKVAGEQGTADVNKLPLDQAINVAHEKLAVPLGSASDADHAYVISAIQKADEVAQKAKVAGDTATYDTYRREAAGLHDSLSEHLTAKGQGGQIATLLYDKTPQGMYYKAEKLLKNAGGFDDETGAKLQDLADQIKGASDNATKKQLTAQFHKTVADKLPQGKLQNALSVWKAGLLSGTKTQGGNLLSNATFGALKKVSDAPAAAVDKLISLKTGVRTKAFTGQGIGNGTKEGISKGVDTLKTGIDSRNISGSKYEQHGELNFKNPVIQNVFGKPSNAVFRAMSAADQPTYFAAAKNNLADMALAESKNQGLKGAERNDFVKNLMNNPTKEMAEKAGLAAQKAVLGQDNKLASSFTKVAQAHPAAQVLAPFIKVPTNFITRTLDFTPVGAVKTAVQQIRAGKLDQRALSEAIGEATTGTAVLGLGAELANNKMLSGQYPSDPKEQQRWKAEDIQPNSVKVGGKWISLNYLGPAALLLGAGKDYHDALAQGNSKAASTIASAAGIGKNLEGQSFLSGFSGFSDAINDPQRSAKSFINSEAGSVVPSWLNDIGNTTDSKQRLVNTPVQSAESRLPIARNNLPVKTDVYGNQLSQPSAPLNAAINPLKPSNDLSQKNPVVSEVNRLHNVDPNNKDLQVTPEPIGKSVSVEGKQVKLNDKQAYDLQNQAGQAIQNAWGELIKTPQYQALDDTDKAKALSGLRTDVTTLATREYVVDNNLGTYNKPVTNAVASLSNGNANIANYALSATNSSTTKFAPNLDPTSTQTLQKYDSLNSDQRKQAEYSQNDFDYKYAVAKYNNDVANGSLSKAQAIKAQDSLAKAQVGSQYSKDVRDLYGLSKADISDFVSSDPNGQKYAQQLQAYDQALYQSGAITTPKFENGFSSGSSSRSGLLPSLSVAKPKSFKVKVGSAKAPKHKSYKLLGTTKAPKKVKVKI